MKAPAFLYRRPDTLEEALRLLSENSGEAQILAGGQSLIPTLNMRLSSPGMLVDINRIAALRPLTEHGDTIHIGALVRHCEVLESAVVAARVPLLASAMTHVAHMAVRNRGTTCGSLALADPSAEAPAVAVLLDATIHLQGIGGVRDLPAREFFQGLYATDRRDDEMITGASFPCARDDEVFRFSELSRRHGDFAVVGTAVKGRHRQGSISDIEVVVFGSEPAPMLAATSKGMAIAPDTGDGTLRDMAQSVADVMNPIDNHQGRPDTKRQQAAEMLRRCFLDLRGLLHVRH